MRRLFALVAPALGALLLAGCGAAADSGQAAVSDRFRIAQSEVDADVRAVRAASGQPVTQAGSNLAQIVVQRLVQDQLIEAQAADMGLEVTPAEVDRAVAELAEQNGGDEALAQIALQSGIPTDEVDAQVRTNLLLSRIGPALQPEADQAAQQAAVQQALSELSRAIDVRVAPRFGVWDDAALGIRPGSQVASGQAQ